MARGSIKKRDTASGPRWDVRLSVQPDSGGKRQQICITCRSRAEAERVLAERLAEQQVGLSGVRTTQTVGEMLTYWMETHVQPNCRVNTVRLYQRAITLHLCPGLGGVKAAALTPARIQTFYRDRLKAGVGRPTLRVCHIVLSGALKQAVTQGALPRNVASSAVPPRVVVHPMTVWSPAEARTFLEAITGERDAAFWTLLLTTGVRRGEALGLRWSDIDATRGVVRVRTQAVRGDDPAPPAARGLGRLKTDSSRRTISAPPALFAVLHPWRAAVRARQLQIGPLWQDLDLVFPGPSGAPQSGMHAGERLHALSDHAALPRIRVHDLRHTYATLLLRQGVAIHVVSAMLGHADAAMTLRVYAHVLDEQRDEVAVQITNALFAVAR